MFAILRRRGTDVKPAGDARMSGMSTPPLPVPTPDERAVLRELATDLAALTRTPLNQERRDRAYEHNDLGGHRPLLLVLPEGAWREGLPDTALRCRAPLLRCWEQQLRQQIITARDIGADNVVEDVLDVNWVQAWTDYGVPVVNHRAEQLGSYHWDPPLKDLDRDLDRLSRRTVTIDHAATEAQAALARDLVGDRLCVRMRSGFFWTAGLTWEAIKLFGMQEMFLAMHDQPEGLKRLMGFLRDDLMGIMDQLEAQGVLDSCAGANSVGSGGIGFTRDLPSIDPRQPSYRSPVGFGQRWGLSESQETVGVSPEMFGEFVLPFQRPLVERFGLVCYGCCEPVDTRIDQILTLPRLRRVSVSPWADREVMAKALGRRIIYNRKPNPAHVCVGFDEPAIRQELRETLRIAGDLCLEFVLKDTHTVEGDFSRFARWTAIAREEIARHYGDRA